MALAVAAALLTARPTAAFHTRFDFAVSRVEYDGNGLGPADDLPDLVYDFATEAASADWFEMLGTVQQRFGALHFQQPGEHLSIGGAHLDISVANGGPRLVFGDGPFSVTAHWEPLPIPPGNFIHTTMWITGTFSQQFVGLDVSNLPGQGLKVRQHEELFTGTWGLPGIDEVPIDAAAITGPIVLQVHVDDTNRVLTTAFSLDGGATFHTPFAALPIVASARNATVLLGADPMARGLCGNGTVEGSEACDLGWVENDRAACCTAACTLVDTDHDGTCDPQDRCPSLSDPEQLDGDVDGIGDACDPCTALDEGQRNWRNPLVALLHVNDERPGNETLRVEGTFAVAATAPPIDPIATGLRVQVRSLKDGTSAWLDLPAGPAGSGDTGWAVSLDGRRFAFRDSGRRRGGMTRALVRRLAGTAVQVKLLLPRSPIALGTWTYPPLAAVVSFGTAPGSCAKIGFPPAACAFPASSRSIVCR